jgi:anti-anti-sigma factor
MNTNRTGATTGVDARGGPGIPKSTRRGRARSHASPDERAASEASRALLASVKPWTHTLIVTGELNGGSAAELEAEIETLFEEGVTGIRLDLRKLEELDSVGAAVLAFRSGLCARRGYEFAVIPGSPEMHAVLAVAGVRDLVTGEHDDAGRPASGATSQRALAGPRVH